MRKDNSKNTVSTHVHMHIQMQHTVSAYVHKHKHTLCMHEEESSILSLVDLFGVNISPEDLQQ